MASLIMEPPPSTNTPSVKCAPSGWFDGIPGGGVVLIILTLSSFIDTEELLLLLEGVSYRVVVSKLYSAGHIGAPTNLPRSLINVD